jgi:hypothetical protein
VADEAGRAAWRAHLHGDGAEPAEPRARAPLVFRGRSSAGSVVERSGSALRATTPSRSTAPRSRGSRRSWISPASTPPHSFALDSTVFRETFSISPAAMTALREFASARAPSPPWEYAAELAGDGVVGRHLELTARGRRALASTESGPDPSAWVRRPARSGAHFGGA